MLMMLADRASFVHQKEGKDKERISGDKAAEILSKL